MATSSSTNPFLQLQQHQSRSPDESYQQTNASFKASTPPVQGKDKAMLVTGNHHIAGQRLMLLYADSSDEEDFKEESEPENDLNEIFSLQSQAGHRNDSLREIVYLKDTKPHSFKEKPVGKRLSIPPKSRQIQLNSKHLVGVYVEQDSLHLPTQESEEVTSISQQAPQSNFKPAVEDDTLQVKSSSPTGIISGEVNMPESHCQSRSDSPVQTVSTKNKTNNAQIIAKKDIVLAKPTHTTKEIVVEGDLDAGNLSIIKSQKSQKGDGKIDTITEFESQEIGDTTGRGSVVASSAQQTSVVSRQASLKMAQQHAQQKSRESPTPASKKADNHKLPLVSQQNQQKPQGTAALPGLVKKGTYGESRQSFMRFGEGKEKARSLKIDTMDDNNIIRAQSGEDTQKFSDKMVQEDNFSVKRQDTFKRAEVSLNSGNSKDVRISPEAEAEIDPQIQILKQQSQVLVSSEKKPLSSELLISQDIRKNLETFKKQNTQISPEKRSHFQQNNAQAGIYPQQLSSANQGQFISAQYLPHTQSAFMWPDHQHQQSLMGNGYSYHGHISQPLFYDDYQRNTHSGMFSPLGGALEESPAQDFLAISRNGLVHNFHSAAPSENSRFIPGTASQFNASTSHQYDNQHQGFDTGSHGSVHHMQHRFASTEKDPQFFLNQGVLNKSQPLTSHQLRPKSSNNPRKHSTTHSKLQQAQADASSQFSPVASTTQFMFQGAEAGVKPKRVRPTTAASNVRLYNQANNSRSRGGGVRETFFSAQAAQDSDQSPRCSRERCRELIKQQLILKQQTRARRGVAQSSLSQTQPATRLGKIRTNSLQQPRQVPNQQKFQGTTSNLKSQTRLEKDNRLAKAYHGAAVNLSNTDIEVSLQGGAATAESGSQNPTLGRRRSSYRKLKMLPWCRDERDEIVHTEYIRFLAQMDSKTRSKATKHAIVAASSLLRVKRGVKVEGKGKEEQKGGRRVAWHEQKTD